MGGGDGRARPLYLAGCAAGLKTLELFERDGVVDHAARLGAVAAELMADWAERHALVRQVRANGLLIGVSIGSPEDREDPRWYARELNCFAIN